MKYWFTSDTHFGHENILDFCADTRPFKSIEEHDRAIISFWQSNVMPDDVVYHLGDVSFSTEERTNRIFEQLPGEKYLIWGNHDKLIRKSEKLQRHFTGIADYKEISIDREKIVLFHFPIYEWNKMHRGAFHFYGHVHGTVQIAGRAWDVGVDTRPARDASLWAWEDLRRMMLAKEIRTHHGVSVETLRRQG